MASLSGPAPSTMPTASARNTEIRDTRWERKSITSFSCRVRGSCHSADELPHGGPHGVQPCAEQPQRRLARRCGCDGDRESEQAGEHQPAELPVRDALTVQPGHALGVDQLPADAELVRKVLA